MASLDQKCCQIVRNKYVVYCSKVNKLGINMPSIPTLFAVSKQLTSSLCRFEFILPVFFIPQTVHYVGFYLQTYLKPCTPLNYVKCANLTIKK